MRPARLPVGRASLQVYTSPHPSADYDPEPALLALINGAKNSILFGVYSFTLPDVGQALIRQQQAGVKIRGLGDAGEWGSKTSQFPSLAAAGIDVRQWGGAYQLMHLKVAVVDGEQVAWGSWNWTSQAEKANQEVMTTARSIRLANVLITQLQAAYAAGKAPA